MEAVGKCLNSCSKQSTFVMKEILHLTRIVAGRHCGRSYSTIIPCLHFSKLKQTRRIYTTARHDSEFWKRNTKPILLQKTDISDSSQILGPNQNVFFKTQDLSLSDKGLKLHSHNETQSNKPASPALVHNTWCRRLSSLQSVCSVQSDVIKTCSFDQDKPWCRNIRINEKQETQLDAQKPSLSAQGYYNNGASSHNILLRQTQGDIKLSVLVRGKSNIVPGIHKIYQSRFYRGRTRKQSLQTETNAEDSVPEEEGFEVAVGSFQSDLQEQNKEFGKDLVPASVEEMSIPELSRHSYNLVPYVSRSETLQNLVKLGVNLDVVQRVEGVAELLLQSQFERDIAPLIHLLNMAGVPADAMGQMITRNPLLLTQSIDDLSSRIGYLLHKKFTQEEVASVITRAPVILLMDPVKLDSKLAFLQTTFSLTGQEVRGLVLKYPKVVPWRRDMIANVRFHLKEFLAFSDSQLKIILLKEPKNYLTHPNRLTEVFDYLHGTMGITREQMMVWPSILRTRPFIIRDRHLFLTSLSRAQYNPCQENFVSLRALGASRDDEFCRNVAKCDVAAYHDFLKSL